jgi:hypothetical protein
MTIRATVGRAEIIELCILAKPAVGSTAPYGETCRRYGVRLE